jgi:hypothetical protein
MVRLIADLPEDVNNYFNYLLRELGAGTPLPYKKT